jgi:hypothetical protein
MKSPDLRVGHWDSQRERGKIVRGPEPGTSHPPGQDGLLRGNRGQYGRALGPCQRYSLPVRPGSLDREEHWYLLADEGTSEVMEISPPITPKTVELARPIPFHRESSRPKTPGPTNQTGDAQDCPLTFSWFELGSISGVRPKNHKSRSDPIFQRNSQVNSHPIPMR